MTGVTPDSPTRPSMPGAAGPATAMQSGSKPPPQAPPPAEPSHRDPDGCWELLQRGDGTAVPAPLEAAKLSGAGLAAAHAVGPLATQPRRLDDAVPTGGRAARRLAEVCHDMRQPLTTIQYLVQVALDDSRGPSIHRTLSKISSQVDYLVDLTEQLLAESARVWGSVEVRTLLRAVVATVQGEAAKGSVRVKLSAPEDVDAMVSADRTALQRAVVNLVENAIRVAGPAGEVRISMRRHPGTVEIRVEDTGPGGRGRDEPSAGSGAAHH